MNKIKKILFGLTLIGTLLAPKMSYASTEPLIDMDTIFTDLEKKIMNRKGFDWRVDLGGYIDPVYINETDPPITEQEMKNIDDWCKKVIKVSGAAKAKTQKEKAMLLSMYLKTMYPYDVAGNTNIIKYIPEASQIRSIPYRGKAQCAGFSRILVRLLDVSGIESYVPFCRLNNTSHAVVRAFLDGKWETIETTGHFTTYNYYQHRNNMSEIEGDFFPEQRTPITYFIGTIPYPYGPEDDFNEDNGTEYNVFVEKDIEDYLSKNNFNIYGY